MEASISSIIDLPHEQQMQIFSFLPVKNVVMGRLVCRLWNGLLREPSIWKRFYIQLIPSRQQDSKIQPTKIMHEVVKKLKSLKLYLFDKTRREEYHLALIDARVKLNRVGTMFDVSEAYKDAQKRLEQSESSHENNIYARALIKRLSYDFEKVRGLIPFLTNEDQRTNCTLSRVVWKALNQNQIDEVMNLLDVCENFPFRGPCIVDLARLLKEKGQHEKLAQLTSRFSEVLFAIQSKKQQAFYYTFTDRLDRAEAIALELKASKDSSAKDVFTMLEREYRRNNNSKEADRIISIRPKILDLRDD